MTAREMDPSCRYGYTRDDLGRLLGARLPEFDSWMRGQTLGICDGREYDYAAFAYCETGCGPHGVVAYRHDVRRFLGGAGPLD